MIRIVAAVLVVACAGCSGPRAAGELMSQTPVHSETFAADYQRLASCSHTRLDQIDGVGLKKVDLPTESTVRIAMEAGTARHWELTFVGQGRSRTRVEMTALQTMTGAHSPAYVFQQVKACA